MPSRGPAPAARGRDRVHRASGRTRGVPSALPARRDHEPLPVRCARRRRRGLLVHGAATRRLPSEAVACAARPLRPRRVGSAPARVRARGGPLRGLRGGRGSCRTRARGARHPPAATHSGCRRAPLARRRPLASVGTRSSARRARRTHDRRARRGGRGRPGSRRRGARVPVAAGARVNAQLALAVFASETGTHLVKPPDTARWRDHLRRFDAGAYERRLADRGYRFVSGRPPLLRATHDPPPGLFVRGVAPVEMLARPAVAIVGARACSGYGASVARSLGRELAAAGLVVVSGLARGVDGEAHRGVLDAGGSTVAVLGCGIDRDYPAVHADLARRIAETGLIVSEYAPGVEPAPWRFPARNRIVAGLASATVLVQARERSGALITADLALEEGREVFAVPGEITSALSAGANALLKLGASPLTCAGDVLASFGLERDVPATRDGFLDLLPATADELAQRTGMSAAEVARTLVELELAGAAAVHDGVYRIR